MENDFNQAINDTFPILSIVELPTLWIEYNFDKNSEFKKNVNIAWSNYLNYIQTVSQSNLPLEMFQGLNIVSDFHTLDKKIYINMIDLYGSLCMHLNYNLGMNSFTYDKLYMILLEKINEFEKVKKEDLEKKYPFFYEKTYYPYMKNLIDEYNKQSRDIEKLKSMSREDRRKIMKKKPFVKDFLYQIDYIYDFRKIIHDYAEMFRNILRNTIEIANYIKRNEIDINLKSKEEYRKLDLLIAISMLYRCRRYKMDDKYLLYVRDYFERNKNETDESFFIVISDFYFDGVPDTKDLMKHKSQLIKFTPKMLYELYMKEIQDKEYLRDSSIKMNFSNMNRGDINQYIDTLLDDLKKNFEKIDVSEYSEKILNMINNDKLSLFAVDLFIDKINFLLDHVPIKIIKGEGTFKNYLGYIYEDGYVVLDYLEIEKINQSYGHAIYTIKMSDLKEHSNLTLTGLIDILGKDIRIWHKGDWKAKLEEKIGKSGGLDDVINSDKFEELDIKITLKKLQQFRNELLNIQKELHLKAQQEQEKKNQEEKLKKQDIIKMKKYKQIDDEIKQTEIAESLSDEDKQDLIDAESELNRESGQSNDFVYLHEVSKKIKNKPKRNVDVSLNTKKRTMDENGFMHCDLCESLGIIDESYSSNKSTRMFETHHLIPLSEGGIDNLYNTTCLCPSCHTRIHNYLRLRKKINLGVEFDDSVMGEFMTSSQYGGLLKKVRERIMKSTPEYIPNFDKLFNPNYHEDKDLTEKELIDKYIQEEDYYNEHKQEEDEKFLINWNTPHR